MPTPSGKALISRRTALRAGLVSLGGLAASALGFGEVLATDELGRPDDASEVGADGVAVVEGVAGGYVTARMPDARVVSAELVGFPAGFAPRAGDLVAVDTRTIRPLCAPELAGDVSETSTTKESPPTAHPLTRWHLGTPTIDGNTVRVGKVRLIPSQGVIEAAARGEKVKIATLSTTLAERQVLAVRRL